MQSSNNTASASRPLFGGAITVDLPTELVDASELRQIPDNQEVFLSASSDTSIVIEILALVEEGAAGTDLWEAAKFHFESIAHDNSSLSSTVLTPPPTTLPPSRPLVGPPPCPSPYTPPPTLLAGTQTIHKYSHDPTGAPRPGHEADEPDSVWVGLALWRCWYEPGEGAGAVGGKKKADLVMSVNVNLSAGDKRGQEERERAEAVLRTAAETLRIEDWGLFADAE